MRLRSMLLLTALPCLASACGAGNDATTTSDSSPGVAAATAADAGEVRQAIEAANARYAAAYLRGDTATVADNYAGDAVLMPAGAPAARGRGAIRAWFAPEVVRAPSEVKEFKVTTEDVMLSGDLAVETGTFEFLPRSTTTANATPETGKYVTVWKRQTDGSWKIVRDVFNANAPPPKG